MENNIKSIEELRDEVFLAYVKMFEVKLYLNESGVARLEALRDIYLCCSDSPSLIELARDDQFVNLSSTPARHPEYYKTVREVNRLVEEFFNQNLIN